jgi:hypothetical protein
MRAFFPSHPLKELLQVILKAFDVPKPSTSGTAQDDYSSVNVLAGIQGLRGDL